MPLTTIAIASVAQSPSTIDLTVTLPTLLTAELVTPKPCTEIFSFFIGHPALLAKASVITVRFDPESKRAYVGIHVPFSNSTMTGKIGRKHFVSTPAPSTADTLTCGAGGASLDDEDAGAVPESCSNFCPVADAAALDTTVVTADLSPPAGALG